jgi:hypothetical protein
MEDSTSPAGSPSEASATPEFAANCFNAASVSGLKPAKTSSDQFIIATDHKNSQQNRENDQANSFVSLRRS